ncbi:MAG: hypothetical protein H7070_02420 [Saprospiraceae bacterium]|nr:hypothetical protein [Pyrinomonadaceae bacterium]
MKTSKIVVGAFIIFIVVAAVSVWLGANKMGLFQGVQTTSGTQTALFRASEDHAASAAPIFMFGMTRGQTARLNVLNCGEDQKGFVVNWKFIAADGSVLKETPEPVRIEPGKVASFDLNSDELTATRDRFGRIQMRAVISALGGPDTFERNGSASVEIIDNSTGRSALFVGPAAVKGCSNNL